MYGKRFHLDFQRAEIICEEFGLNKTINTEKLTPAQQFIVNIFLYNFMKICLFPDILSQTNGRTDGRADMVPK
jgi:hypothetical protein